MTQKFILPGSFAVVGGVITCGVHTGAHEWDIKNLRYIEGDLSEGDPSEQLIDIVSRIYDNSTGCVLSNSFVMNSTETS